MAGGKQYSTGTFYNNRRDLTVLDSNFTQMTEKNDKSSPLFICGRIGEGFWNPGHTLPVKGCLIMLCKQGRSSLTINSRKFLMTAGCMGFITFDMVTVPAEVSDDFEAEFMEAGFEVTQDLFFLVTSGRFWDFIYRHPVFRLPDELYGAAETWFSLVGWMSENCTGAVRNRLLRNEAENLILAMSEQAELRLGLLGENTTKNRAWTITNDFVGLLGRHYARHHDVAFYAGCMNITPNYLNIITKRNMGTTAKEQINIQIVRVASMLLDTTDLSVKQIAERLHYNDPSYMCRIFRKHTGMSPIEYRNKLRLERKVYND